MSHAQVLHRLFLHSHVLCHVRISLNGENYVMRLHRKIISASVSRCGMLMFLLQPMPIFVERLLIFYMRSPPAAQNGKLCLMSSYWRNDPFEYISQHQNG